MGVWRSFSMREEIEVPRDSPGIVELAKCTTFGYPVCPIESSINDIHLGTYGRRL